MMNLRKSIKKGFKILWTFPNYFYYKLQDKRKYKKYEARRKYFEELSSRERHDKYMNIKKYFQLDCF